tara:strand:- start:2142 stop:4937 length:2796 start_codon:yes stop_codon:yes gene_type:complete
MPDAPSKLVIVESPTKAATIRKFLDDSYEIEASVGHIRDLANKKSEIKTNDTGRKNRYSDGLLGFLGVDVENDFEPALVVYDNKKSTIRELKKKLKNVSELYLATDEDREGEAIAADLLDELKPGKNVTVHRLIFHEITKDAITRALENPGEIDKNLVEAQRARRVMDRIYGFPTSLLAQRRIRLGVSAGRVQSPTTKLIVDREIERMEYVPAEYLGIDGRAIKKDEELDFKIRLVGIGDDQVAVARDFNTKGSLIKTKGIRWLKEAEAKELEQVIKSQPLLVTNTVEKKGSARPKPPFITSTLQQAAGRKLRLSSRRTMDAAQRLFQNGHITYMRTDSVTLSTEALTQTRSIIEQEYGKTLLSSDVRRYGTSTSGAQEAHEAIRPAGDFRSPEKLQTSLSRDDFEVYNLIWQRTLASQMINQEYIDTRISLIASHNSTELRLAASGRVITQPGFTSVYTETTAKSNEDHVDESEADTNLLPLLREGELVDVTTLKVQLHQTTPPRRWTEASIIEKLESEGIGRPSTYTSILEAIQRRGNCIRRNNTLIPTFTGFAVVNMLEKHFPQLVDLAFSANMERQLDAIATGSATKSEWLRALYFGNSGDSEGVNSSEGFRTTFETAIEEISGRDLATISIGTSDDGSDIGVRVGKNYGPYLYQSSGENEITVGIPDDTIPDEVTMEWATKRINEKLAGDKQVGLDTDSGRAIVVKAGPHGPYFEIVASELELEDSTFKPRRAGLWPHMEIETVTEEDAQLALSFPKELGLHPDNGSPVFAVAQGPYGPYVKCDTEFRSIEAEDRFQAVSSLTLVGALELLAKPKTRGRNQQSASPKKELGSRPDTQAKQVILHLTGRFGPYVTDGEFNASVPKDRDPSSITLDDAVDLLVIREAKIVANGGVSQKPKRKTKARGSKKNTKVSANTNITNILSGDQ